MPQQVHLYQFFLAAETFDNERPVIYTMEQIKEATNNFDDTRKIGEGGYGCVYFAILGEAEVAIKNMRSTRTKEFFAELKVLCRIHHNNVVRRETDNM